MTHIDEMKKLEDHPNQTYIVFEESRRETLEEVTPTMRKWFRETFGYMDYDYNIVNAWEKYSTRPGRPDEPKTALNNGGSTDYYKFKPTWKECGDIIEDRKMNYNQGNIFKASFCFNLGRHEGTDYERELNKIIYFANREKDRLREEERRYANTN